MRDIGHEETDKLIEQLEKKITREYSQAEKELQAKLDDYFRRFKIKDESWQKMVANGEKTAEEYQKWRVSQMMVGDNWKAMRETIAEDMHNANALARGMVAGDMPLAWATNANWATYQIEHDAKVNTGFTLYNHDSAMVLLKDEPELLKPPGKQMQRTFDEWDAYRAGQSVDLTPEKQAAFDKLIAKGKDIRWQEGQIQSITLQSILQGESIPNMTKRIAETLGEINHKSTIRYARTAMTSAQEQGRAHAYQRAEDMGIDMQREWRAVFDMRTRHAHRQLDGQLRGIDEPFEVDGEEIMFPGDPAAAGYLIYNCRCRTTAAVKGWDKMSRQLRSDEAVGGMSYDEWLKGHSISRPIDTQEKIGEAMRQKTIRDLYGGKGGGKNGKPPVEKYKNDKLEKALGKEYSDFADLVTNAPTRGMYEKYMDDCRGLTKKAGSGCFYPGSNTIEWDYTKWSGRSKFSTISHECGHLFDERMRNFPGLSFSEIDLVNKKCVEGRYNGPRTYMTEWPFKRTPSRSDEFIGALRKDMENLKDRVDNGTIKQFLYGNSSCWGWTEEKGGFGHSSSGVQDALDGFFNTQKNGATFWGHGAKYYNRAYNDDIKYWGLEKKLKEAYKELNFDASNQEKVKNISRQYEAGSEAWANVAAAVTCGGKELDAVKKLMPNTLEAFLNIAKGVNK